MAETPIWSPLAIVSSMKAEAALPKRGSEKRYQIAAWVSAIATIIRNQSAENSQTSPRDSDRCPRLMVLVRTSRKGHATSASVLSGSDREPQGDIYCDV